MSTLICYKLKRIGIINLVETKTPLKEPGSKRGNDFTNLMASSSKLSWIPRITSTFVIEPFTSTVN